MLSNIYKSSLIAAFTLALSGCAGHVYTVVNPSLDQNNTKVEGIITYPPMHVIELYKMTLLVDDKSKVVGSLAEHTCVENKVTKLSTRPDYDKPQLVYYDPGIFEKNTFTLTLKDGIVSEIKSESDTTQALKDIPSIVTALTREPTGKAPIKTGEPLPLCNAGESFIGVYQAPNLLPFKEYREQVKP